MPLNYAWYNQTFGLHPTTRADFEKYFDSSGRYPQVTFGGAGIYTGPLNFGNSGTGMPNTPPSFLPTVNMSFKVEGYIYIPVDGTYSFRTNGDDAVDLIIDGQVIAYWYGPHAVNNGTTSIAPSSWIGTVTLTKGYHHFIGRFETVGGQYAMELSWKKPGDSAFYVIPNTQFNTEYVSKVHASTPLPIKTCLSVDKNTVFLAHYDVTIEESLNGIKPYGTPVATLRSAEGKFGGGVAVEESTTNVVSNMRGNYTNLATVDPNPPVLAPIDVGTQSYWHFPSGNYAGVQFNAPDMAVNDVYTISWYAYIPTPGNIIWNSQLDSDVSSNRILYNTSTSIPIAGWYRFSFTTTFTSAEVGPKMRIENKLPTLWSSGSNECWVTGVQLEKKSFATSFIDGSRATGTLKYYLNDDINTISFWFKTAIPNNYSAGVNWVMSDIDTADNLIIWKRLSEDYYRVRVQLVDFTFLNTDIVDGQFYMVSLTSDGVNTKIYLNGKYKGSIAQPLITKSFGLSLHPTQTGVGNNIFDEIRMDRVQRTDDEIEQWYLSQSPFFPKGVHRVYA